MTDTFSFKTTTESNLESQFLSFTAKFGDGYAQDIPKGINTEDQRWTVTISGYWETETKAVRDWLRAHEDEVFFWKPRTETAPLTFKCKKYSLKSNGGDHWTITMEFEQRYLP